MSDVAFAIHGASGRMGQAIRSIAGRPLLCISPEIPVEHASTESWFTSFERLEPLPHVIIDFSVPDGCLDALDFCVENSIPFVTGTTGLSEDERKLLHIASKRIPVLFASNFSVGVHLLAKAVSQLAAATSSAQSSDNWDIEIYEAHHRNKVDAPGGTAIFLGEKAAEARKIDFQEKAVFSRVGHTGPRTDEEIGYQVLRGGSIVGTHRVSFCGEGELVELTHQALDRTIFARGALRAANWILQKEAGFYGMEDVLFGS